jgi:hypothetical protein
MQLMRKSLGFAELGEWRQVGSLDEYRESLQSSRQWFEKNHGPVNESFQLLDDGFNTLAAALREGRDAEGHSHISLAPFLLLMQRQSFVALDALSSMQAYQAWVLIRPGLECALIMGKWMEDIANYHSWTNRFQDPEAYRTTYSGKKMVSRSLPRSRDLQQVLKTINDSFVHPNPEYYVRHITFNSLEAGETELRLDFFDNHEVHWASVLALLHLLILTQVSIAKMFDDRFVNVGIDPEHFGLAGFEAQHRDQATVAAAVGIRERHIIRDLGLWDLETKA